MNVFDWQVENQDPLPIVCEENADALCKRGIHQLMLDEEIGSICRFCSYLDQEIKYIVPEFVSLCMFLLVKSFFFLFL